MALTDEDLQNVVELRHVLRRHRNLIRSRVSGTMTPRGLSYEEARDLSDVLSRAYDQLRWLSGEVGRLRPYEVLWRGLEAETAPAPSGKAGGGCPG